MFDLISMHLSFIFYCNNIVFMQQPEWKGGQSQRFSGGKVHLRPEG